MPPTLKCDTRSLLYIARRTREHWTKKHSQMTRKELAGELRAYLHHNDHRSVRSAYQRGDALYGYL